MSSELPEDIMNRLTNALMLSAFGNPVTEEVGISYVDQRTSTNETNSEENNNHNSIDSCEQLPQIDRNDNANPSIEDSTKYDDKSTKVSNIDGDNTDEDSIHDGDDGGNDSDVVEVSDNEEDIFKKLDGQKLECTRCYPSQFFPHHQKSLFIIHRSRHFAEDHFICPTCQEGFVKLIYCIRHELRVHKEETQLNDQRFATAVSLILASGKRNSTILVTDTENTSASDNSKAEKNVIYSDYAVASSSLYPYSGPPVDGYPAAYETQYKYGRPKKSNLNTMAEKVHNAASSNDESDSSYSIQANPQPKKYRKTVKKVSKPNKKCYSCRICHFIYELEVEFKEHCKAQHPNCSADQVVEYLIIASSSSGLRSNSPVTKKRSNNGPSRKRKTRVVLSDDSSRDSTSEFSSLNLSTPSADSLVSVSSMPDYSTQDDFCYALGLVRKEVS